MDNDVPVGQSYLHWLYMALGIKYTFLLSVAALAAFVLALIVVLRGKGPMAGAALLLIVPMPFFIGLYGGIEGLMSMNMVIAASTVRPPPSELANANALALAAPMIGTLLMVPAYAVAMIGLLLRSLAENSNRPPPPS